MSAGTMVVYLDAIGKVPLSGIRTWLARRRDSMFRLYIIHMLSFYSFFLLVVIYPLLVYVDSTHKYYIAGFNILLTFLFLGKRYGILTVALADLQPLIELPFDPYNRELVRKALIEMDDIEIYHEAELEKQGLIEYKVDDQSQANQSNGDNFSNIKTNHNQSHTDDPGIEMMMKNPIHNKNSNHLGVDSLILEEEGNEDSESSLSDGGDNYLFPTRGNPEQGLDSLSSCSSSQNINDMILNISKNTSIKEWFENPQVLKMFSSRTATEIDGTSVSPISSPIGSPKSLTSTSSSPEGTEKSNKNNLKSMRKSIKRMLSSSSESKADSISTEMSQIQTYIYNLENHDVTTLGLLYDMDTADYRECGISIGDRIRIKTVLSKSPIFNAAGLKISVDTGLHASGSSNHTAPVICNQKTKVRKKKAGMGGGGRRKSFMPPLMIS
jgi:hypothetical protein